MTAKKHILFESDMVKRLRQTLNLQKIGINYFCKCPFCNDPGSHFCIKSGAAKYVCLNCGRHGDTEALLPAIKTNIPDSQSSILDC